MTALTLTPRPAAGTKIEIPVTREHIDRGQPCLPGDCALTLAIIDVIPGAAGVTVAPNADDGYLPYARIWTGPGSWIRLAFGADARDFMEAFDDGEAVRPAVFIAEVA